MNKNFEKKNKILKRKNNIFMKSKKETIFVHELK